MASERRGGYCLIQIFGGSLSRSSGRFVGWLAAASVIDGAHVG